MNKFEKRLAALRLQLEEAKMFDALVAMGYASGYHKNTRKDLVTPEFDHQVCIALYTMTLPDLMYREEVIATIMLHDLREDYQITDQEIVSLFLTNPIRGRLIADAVDAMTKLVNGQKRDEIKLFEIMARNPIASIAKGSDRIHNIQSMVTVFTPEKQCRYISEVRDLFFPMLKTARKLFPNQLRAYQNIRFVLKSQIELIENISFPTQDVDFKNV